MYKYVYEGNKVVMTYNDEVICDAEINVDEDVAILEFNDIKKVGGTSMLSSVSKLCNEVKRYLNEKGINVSKVQCGRVLEVAKYDETLDNLVERVTNMPIASNKR